MLALGQRDGRALPAEAWLLNYTNPMAMLCELVYKGTPTQNVVGLCHSVQARSRISAELVGVPAGARSRSSPRASTTRRSSSASSTTARASTRGSTSGSRPIPELQRRVRVALYRRFGYFPTESSEHAAEYVPWFMRHDDELERYRVPVDEYIRRSEDEPDRVRAREGRARPRGEPIAVERSNEYASTIVNSMVTGEPA